MCHAQEKALAALYDAMVREIRRSPSACSLSIVVATTFASNALYEKYYSAPGCVELQQLLNVRMDLEHGLNVRNLRMERRKRCEHRACDCGCPDDGVTSACCLWNIMCGCVPLIYWIPRLCGCMALDEWCITATFICT